MFLVCISTTLKAYIVYLKLHEFLASFFTLQQINISTLSIGETLLRTRLIVSLAFENTRGGKAKHFLYMDIFNKLHVLSMVGFFHGSSDTLTKFLH